jgi:hypothetical protein
MQQKANASVHDLITLLDCGRISSGFNSALLTICKDDGLVGNFVGMFIYIAAAELLFIIARWFLPICNCCRYGITSIIPFVLH